MTDLFYLAQIPDDTLRDVVAAAAGDCGDITGVTVTRFPYRFGSLPTAGLWLVAAEHGTPNRTTFFVKLLRHPRLSPDLRHVPEDHRAALLAYLPWHFELDIYESGIGDTLPDGMRTPTLHHVHRFDDDHIALWWEYVPESQKPWCNTDFTRSAYLLGRLAARRRAGAQCNSRLPSVCLRTDRQGALRYYVETRVMIGSVPAIADRAVWDSPLLAGAADDPDLRDDLLTLAERVPDLLDQLDTLPQTFAHGDASPRNLLIPASDPAQRVVIDWGFGTPLPIGFDLGQLLVGLAHEGGPNPSSLPRLAPLIESAYRAGLDAEGYSHSERDVHTGFIGGIAVRSALCAIPFEMLDAPATPELHDQMTDRLRLSRVMVDLAASL